MEANADEKKTVCVVMKDLQNKMIPCPHFQISHGISMTGKAAFSKG